MIKTRIFVFTILVLLSTRLTSAQNLTQSIRGKVTDQDTEVPLIGVTVMVLNTDPIAGTVTDMNGNFSIDKLALGRYDLKISYVGYEDIYIRQVLASSGKQVKLNIKLKESITTLQAITVLASEKDKDKPISDMATVSTKAFSVEETGRYAGSFNDPARMAQSFAGVATNSGNNNEIVIRGNAARGLLWRLEGIEIPNPNHFSTGNGSSGGGISMLSNTILANSDFFSGAFPAAYGNALSGVFDLNLRKGNYEKREYAFQLGFLGLQAAAEGLFSKKSEASYLVNYRYSTLGLLNKFGIHVGPETAVPEYQDMSFNFYVPTKNAGRFSLFGIGGLSSVRVSASQDSARWFSRNDKLERTQLGKTGVLGLSHTYLFKNSKTYMKTVLAYTVENNRFLHDSLNNEYQSNRFFRESYTNNATRISTLINHKFNAKHVLRSGLIYSYLQFNTNAFGLDFQINPSQSLNNLREPIVQNSDEQINTHFAQSYIQWKFRVFKELEINTGIHHTSFSLNNNHIIEPRFGVKWQFRQKHIISYGLGLHSRLAPIAIYLANLQKPQGNAVFIFAEGNSFLFSPKTSLRLTQSVHNVMSYSWNFARDFHLKAEVYYQHIFNLPVEDSLGSTLSVVNFNSFDRVFSYKKLTNQGKGHNYGLELTLEKFFSQQYYFLLTTSLFESKYTALDKVVRNTRFNKNYLFNVVGGKEFTFGKNKENIIDFNLKVAWLGGNRVTPIDLEASKLAKYPVFITDRAFEHRLPDFFRIDLKVGYRINKPKYTLITSLDIQNITNRSNVQDQFYDVERQKIRKVNSLGILPVLNFRLEF